MTRCVFLTLVAEAIAITHQAWLPAPNDDKSLPFDYTPTFAEASEGKQQLGISLKNSPTIFGTVMILVGSAARRRYNHIAALPII